MRKEKLTQKERIARLEKVCSQNAFNLMPLMKFMEDLKKQIEQDPTQVEEEEQSNKDTESRRCCFLLQKSI